MIFLIFIIFSVFSLSLQLLLGEGKWAKLGLKLVKISVKIVNCEMFEIN